VIALTWPRTPAENQAAAHLGSPVSKCPPDAVAQSVELPQGSVPVITQRASMSPERDPRRPEAS
jgi:hypothetical protein